MRTILRRIISILDGTPAIYGKRQAGQSMVELAMVTPLLIILLAGLVEIGWFANNYLSLLDVTRFGARRATVLIDQQAPNAADWLPEFTYVPQSRFTGGETAYAMPYISAADTEASRSTYRYDPANPTTGACNPNFAARLFYNEIICTMIVSLEPLFFDTENGVDDIIISGFSVEMIDASIESDWLAPYPVRPINADTAQMVVAGRWPTNANECDVVGSGPLYAISPREPRDPFDINDNGVVDDGTGSSSIDGVNDYAELIGYDATAATVSTAERQVGFSLFGQRKIPDTLCVGSSWTIAEVERLFNLPNFNIAAADSEARSKLPGQGVVLVEMYWEHTMLLQIPVLSPVFTAVGNDEGKMVISVWAAFPLPAVEPYIVFPNP